MACFSAESPDPPLTTTSRPGQGGISCEVDMNQGKIAVISLLKVLKSPALAAVGSSYNS